MATITQLAPTSVSLNGEATGDYVNQINVSGVVTQPVNFVTLVSSPALTVANNGALYTTGVLENGTYSVSGTVSDSGGNTGVWAFTMTVVGIPSPEVSLVPQVPVLPTGIEMAVPFQIDPATGGVAYLSSYADIIQQHVLTIVLTDRAERVMLPGYGSKLQEAVFEPIGQGQNNILANDIKNSIAAWEPAVTVLKVTVNGNVQQLSQLDVTVQYTINPFGDVNTVSVTAGGTVSQVIAL
jgi:phage baseplate assembly protein W